MSSFSTKAKVYIISIILIGLGLIVWDLREMAWWNPWLYLLALLGAAAQIIKVEGPNDKTNYNIAWFVYGFTFIALGAPEALFVITAAHLAEWAWHKYPWFIQSFNIGMYAIIVYLAGGLKELLSLAENPLDLSGLLGMIAILLFFVLGNHWMVGMVVKLARGQTFAESGVFEFVGLSLDFAILTLGAVTALVWAYSPFAALLTSLPLILLYQALRLPAMMRRLSGEI
jgi:hypothetical protein